MIKIYVHQIQHYNQDQNIKNVIGDEYYCILAQRDSLIYRVIYSFYNYDKLLSKYVSVIILVLHKQYFIINTKHKIC